MTKILVLTANAGAGHIQAAKALQKGFSKLGHKAEVIDCLDFAWSNFRRMYSDGYIWLIKKFPDVWRGFYHSSDNWHVIEKSAELRKRMKRFFLPRFVNFLQSSNPDIIVCTHFLPLEISTDLKREGRISCPIVCAITDFRAHRFWMIGNKYVDKYLVAAEITKKDLTSRAPKIPESKIAVTGIPINFEASGKEDDIFKILLLGGAFSVMPLRKVIDYIDRINMKMKIAVAVGKNEELMKEIQQMKTDHEIEVFGFVSNMPKLMQSCDVAVSKAGGIVSSEAMASELPMLIIDPIPGQEDNNRRYLVKKGAAVSISKLNKLEDIKNNLTELMTNPLKLELMKTAAREIGKPDSALDCAKESLKLLGIY